jgi:hypothetical protein
MNTALFSDDGLYRYRLTRTLGKGEGTILFIMLNPSTANDDINDPTVERCERRARDLGYAKLIVVNLFALKSTDPKNLRKHEDPIGGCNDEIILLEAMRADLVVCAWGTYGDLYGRGIKVRDVLIDAGVKLHCLVVNKNGTPKHPLYVRRDLNPILWRFIRPKV